ncbi:MAG: N-acetyl-gamma-glutamyl-phosphate reductase [Anaerolineae bacterium]|nr:N-acetyl-gamma-glutamyl-phosphate reductase [Anaerolineae bacterium]
MANARINVGIFGATGYTGIELVKLLGRHGKAHLQFAHSESNPGLKLSDVLPCPYDIKLIKSDDAPLSDIDMVFSCLPHAASAELCKRVLDAGKRVVDFSADFRLRNVGVYNETYKHTHPHPELLGQAVYGLPEVYRADIAETDLVGNPGCYPTSVILGSLPLLELGALADPVIIADSKSGVSGAGRKPSQTTHFVEVNESLNPYNIGHVHRHVPEIEQELNANWLLVNADGTSITNNQSTNNQSTNQPITLLFQPQLLPISRGMLSMLYFKLTPEAQKQDWHSLFARRYSDEPFMRVLPKGQIATIAHVNHTNYCAISVHQQTGTLADRLIVVSCIDNLIKGASGQALQNMNLMFGCDEREGLL